jgi:hypothetical protein
MKWNKRRVTAMHFLDGKFLLRDDPDMYAPGCGLDGDMGEDVEEGRGCWDRLHGRALAGDIRADFSVRYTDW